MTILPNISSESQTCSQCANLGLAKEGIQAGENHLMMAHENKVLFCCLDCFARLSQEVEDALS